jgi:hypothetical protein
MIDQPTLTEAEWTLVIELLEREMEELPVEIHHTRSSQMRSDLAQRRDMVRELLARLRPVAVV